MKDSSIDNLIDEPQNQRYNRTSIRPIVKTPLKSIISDIKLRKNRYEYLEFFLRNWPGELGVSLRYHILSHYYEHMGENVIIWPGVRVKHPYKLNVGNNSQLGYNSMYQSVAGITIGDNVLIGPGVKIWTMNHQVGDLQKDIIDQDYDCAPVIIEDNCWLASNVFIKPGTHLPKGCVVTPNTVVHKIKYEENSVISGNPAKIIGQRNYLKIFQKNEEK